MLTLLLPFDRSRRTYGRGHRSEPLDLPQPGAGVVPTRENAARQILNIERNVRPRSFNRSEGGVPLSGRVRRQ